MIKKREGPTAYRPIRMDHPSKVAAHDKFISFNRLDIPLLILFICESIPLLIRKKKTSGPRINQRKMNDDFIKLPKLMSKIFFHPKKKNSLVAYQSK